MSGKSADKPNGSKYWSNDQNNKVPSNSSVQETDSEIEERLANIFRHLDKNGNGRIDIQELTSTLKDSGVSRQYAEVSSFSQFFSRPKTKNKSVGELKSLLQIKHFQQHIPNFIA